MKCASIDLGTNTARLLIGDLKSGRLETISIEREIIRLGGGFTDEFGLSDDAQQRAMNCLRRFASIIKVHNVRQVRASATSAVRDAVNGSAFVENVLSNTEIRLNVIDGKLEGELTLKGVISGLDTVHENIHLMDIGGGSTEITIVEQGQIVYVESLPLGVVRLTEGFSTPESMTERISGILEGLQSRISTVGMNVKPDSVMIATAGTATTLAAIKMKMMDYDYRRVNNSLLSRMEIAGIYERILPMNNQERLLVPGLEAGREDLIIAGILLTLQFMDFFGFTDLKVSDYGLLEGLALSVDGL